MSSDQASRLCGPYENDAALLTWAWPHSRPTPPDSTSGLPHALSGIQSSSTASLQGIGDVNGRTECSWRSGSST